MSRYSGVYDVADLVSSFDPSDELAAFAAFKAATGGEISQYRRVEVTPDNIGWVADHSPSLSYKPVKIAKKTRSGKIKEADDFAVSYWGREYGSLKELNKKGVYARIAIPFETILDLIPYYPYAVSAHVHSPSGDFVSIPAESEPRREFRLALESGRLPSAHLPFRDEALLQAHYADAVRAMDAAPRRKRERKAPIAIRRKRKT